MADTVQYHYAHLADGGSAINRAVSRMDEILSNIEQVCRPIETGDAFGGEAAEAYKQRKIEWNQSAQKIKDTLTNVQRAVEQAAESMQSADKAAARNFA